MSSVPTVRNQADPDRFNRDAALPFQLRLMDFELAMQFVTEFFRVRFC
jgi:hypothetical protein